MSDPLLTVRVISLNRQCSMYVHARDRVCGVGGIVWPASGPCPWAYLVIHRRPAAACQVLRPWSARIRWRHPNLWVSAARIEADVIQHSLPLSVDDMSARMKSEPSAPVKVDKYGDASSCQCSRSWSQSGCCCACVWRIQWDRGLQYSDRYAACDVLLHRYTWRLTVLGS